MEKKTKAPARTKRTATPARPVQPRATATRTKAAPAAARAAKPRLATARTKAAVPAASGPPVAPSHEQIAMRAHDLFASSGHQHGSALDNWLAAERELKRGMKL